MITKPDVINLQGPLLVYLGGQRVAGFRSHKTIALLAYLVIENRTVARDHLAAMLWPDSVIAKARGHLRRSLYDLTHKLPDRFLLDRETIAFNPTYMDQCDVHRFEQLRQAGDHQSLEAAAQLLRGELLEGLALVDCPVFEEWLWNEREKSRRKGVVVIETLLRRHCVRAQFERALDCAWQLVKFQPWREERYQELMILSARVGDPAMGLAIYKRCRQMLKVELDLDASPETVVLSDRIKRMMTRMHSGSTFLATPVANRTGELADIIRDLITPGTRLITLVGPDATENWRLALYAGSQANGPVGYLFLDGIYPVLLHGANTASHVITAIGSSLGITSPKKPVALDLILRYLRDKEVLIILDGSNLPDEACPSLAKILEETQSVKLLAASRERLNIAGEKVVLMNRPRTGPFGSEFPMTPMDDPHSQLGMIF